MSTEVPAYDRPRRYRGRGHRALAAIHDIREMHFQYRAPAFDEYDTCAYCNQLARGYVRWPCATYQAIEKHGL